MQNRSDSFTNRLFIHSFRQHGGCVFFAEDDVMHRILLVLELLGIEVIRVGGKKELYTFRMMGQ